MSRAVPSNNDTPHRISGETGTTRSNSESCHTISGGTEAEWSNNESCRTTMSSGTRADRSNSESCHTTISGGIETDDSDVPPGSIAVPITEITSWQYGSAYDSGDSAREITNPKSHSKPGPSSNQAGLGPTSNQAVPTNLNATVRAPIISIPAKMKLPTFAHNHGSSSIFPNWRSNRLKRSGLAYSEPSSPKVSCWGKVLSEREKEKLRRQREEMKELKKKNHQVPSCCSRLSVILTCVGDRAVGARGNTHFQMGEVHPQHEEVHQPSKENIIDEVAAGEAETEEGGVPTLKRYSSGRRDEAWCGDLVEEKEGAAN